MEFYRPDRRRIHSNDTLIAKCGVIRMSILKRLAVKGFFLSAMLLPLLGGGLYGKLCLAADSSPPGPVVAGSVTKTVEAPPVFGGYVLGAGDEVRVADVTMGPLDEHVKILQDGFADLPLIGQVQLAGLALDTAQALLNERYAQYYVNPAISMEVISQRPVRVYVQGAVKTPGLYISGKNTDAENADKSTLGTIAAPGANRLYLTDVLMMAGGLKQEANLKDIQVVRQLPEPQTLQVDLWALFKSGSVAQDLPLLENDVVRVGALPPGAGAVSEEWKALSRSNIAQARFNVNVIGAVKQPGSYAMAASDNVLTAIAQAGGFSEMANQKEVFVLRANAAGQVFKKRVNASDARLKGKHANRRSDNWAALMPEDVIFVDESEGRKVLSLGNRVINQSMGAALLPFFNNMLSDD